ncbi:MAG: hypothetical protein WB816_12785 [Methylocystis sp.]
MSEKREPNRSNWTDSLPAFKPRNEGLRDTSYWDDELIEILYSCDEPTVVEAPNMKLKLNRDLEYLNETMRRSSKTESTFNCAYSIEMGEDSLDAETLRVLRGKFVMSASEKLKAHIVAEPIPAAESRKIEPPLRAEFLVGLFTKERYRTALLQSLEEDFERDLATGISVSRAGQRYWAAALSSIIPQALAAIKRIGVVGVVFDYARRWMG